MKIRFTVILGAALLLSAGCVREVIVPKTMLGRPTRELNVEPVTSAKLSLRLVGERRFTAGLPAEVTFALRNTGDKPIQIPEWFSWEGDNLLVYCQPWLPDMTEPDEEQWLPLSFDLHQPVSHCPLELRPGNQVLITKPLPFISKLVVSKNAERRYFLRPELNLKSVKLTGPVEAISVKPYQAPVDL